MALFPCESWFRLGFAHKKKFFFDSTKSATKPTRCLCRGRKGAVLGSKWTHFGKNRAKFPNFSLPRKNSQLFSGKNVGVPERRF